MTRFVLLMAFLPCLANCSKFAPLNATLASQSASLGGGNLAKNNAQVKLAWVAPSPAPQGYTVEESGDGVNFTLQQTITGNVTSTTVTGLTSATTYYFRVNAVNAAGSSPYSSVVSATIP